MSVGMDQATYLRKRRCSLVLEGYTLYSVCVGTVSQNERNNSWLTN